ncbi:RICIN domain-containing protein [Kitasatospora sp. LaBMicrA B282]|uniref:RICIN domain-containing protein n=1 Tax=Kitasatospora sp. LaBMicrA B282 TaxID=3420949 RepID=UPI003D12660F
MRRTASRLVRASLAPVLALAAAATPALSTSATAAPAIRTAATRTSTARTGTARTPAAHPDTAGSVTIGKECLDDAGAGTADGSTVQLLGCNGSPEQQWTWHTDGSVTVFGKCLDITGGSNATGALLELYSCTSRPNQQFGWFPDGTIYAVKSAKCLTVQGTSPADRDRVGLAPCTPSPTEVWGGSAAPPARYTLSAGTPVPFGNADDTPAAGYTDSNGQFYYQSSHSLYGATDGRSWQFYSGADFDTATLAPISTAVNPANSQDGNGDTTWRCNNSPTGLSASYAPAGSGYAERNYCDLVGVWVDPDSGDWYGLVHNEFTPQPFGDGLHYDAIDYAVSRDQGVTWTIVDHAVTTPYSTVRGDTGTFPASTYSYGDGDPRLFTDYRSGYFYVFYLSRAVDKNGGWGGFEEHVARAPIAQKMAAGSWTKWDDGSWSTPGIGGAESDLVPAQGVGTGYLAPGDGYSPGNPGTVGAQIAAGTIPAPSQLSVLNVVWDAYLGKYLGTPENEAGSNQPQHYYVTDDLATEQWTDIGTAGGPQSSWYRWLVDAGSRTGTTVVGKTFRSYCWISCATSDGEYADVTIAPTSAGPLPSAPVNAGTPYLIAAGNGQDLAQSGGGTLTTTTTGAGGPDQQWTFTPTGDGFYTVANAGSGYLLGVDATGNAGRAWGAAPTLRAPGGSATVGEQWSIQTVVQSPAESGPSTPTGAFRLVNRYSDLALSLTGGTQPVATAPQRDWDNPGGTGDTRPAAAQLVTFTPAGGAPDLSGSHVLSTGGEALDDPNWSTTAGIQLDSWAINGGQNQSWVLTRQADGSYTIANAYSTLCADDEGGGTAAGTAVIQWGCTGNDNQRWRADRLPSSAYTFTNVHTGLLLTTAGTGDGALLSQQPDRSSPLQQWSVD